MKLITGLMAGLTASVLVQGCSLAELTRPDPTPAQRPVLSQIDQAAAQAAEALTHLAEIERAGSAKKLPRDVPRSAIPSEMKRRLDVNWVGAPDAIAWQVASAIGYDFKVYGRPPVTPLIVNLDKQDATAYDVFKDVGYQCGDRADIRIDFKEKRIGFFYAK